MEVSGSKHLTDEHLNWIGDTSAIYNTQVVRVGRLVDVIKSQDAEIYKLKNGSA